MEKDIKINESWAFRDCTVKDTSYLTHNYYTYPAKFIPQLASKLILEYSKNNIVVLEPFMVSGTTLLEAILNERKTIGVDINDLSYLITKTKTTAIKPIELEEEYRKLYYSIANKLTANTTEVLLPKNERIYYWFSNEQIKILSLILQEIEKVKNENIKEFFLITFAQILKSSSIWMQKSVKPTRDKNKIIKNAFLLFSRQAKKNKKKNNELYNSLSPDIIKNINDYRKIYCADAKKLPIEDEVVDFIVTSPPYVTSYEYADLHQLSLLWFNFVNEIRDYRKRFIGSDYKDENKIELESKLAEKIINDITNKKKKNNVRTYFADMLESFKEMKRVLKKNSSLAIVIGNTHYSQTKILNAEIFIEQLENIGFKEKKIIKREIPSKMLPSTRDKKTGRFTKTSNKNIKLVYPTEYILILEKL